MNKKKQEEVNKTETSNSDIIINVDKLIKGLQVYPILKRLKAKGQY